MKSDHYQSAATIAAALIAERAAFGARTSEDEAVAMYANLVAALDKAVKESKRVSPAGD